jgi:hypothetical protein
MITAFLSCQQGYKELVEDVLGWYRGTNFTLRIMTVDPM